MGNTNQSFDIRKIFEYVKVIVLVLIPVILLFLPKDYFDSGESVCLSKRLFDFECYACGMTRAVHHLIHLDIDTAIDYNSLSVFVLPVLIYIAIMEIYTSVKRILGLR